jgi:hypothetical protein
MAAPDVGDRWERLEPPSFAPHRIFYLGTRASCAPFVVCTGPRLNGRPTCIPAVALSFPKLGYPATAPSRKYPGPRVAARTSCLPLKNTD